MVDFHVHLLPGVDDGSANKKMSETMMKLSVSQGVEIMVATPHFYFNETETKAFLKRDKAYDKMMEYAAKKGTKMPKVIKGFEVYLSSKILDMENMDCLLIEGTNTILVEMPFEKWTDEIFDRLDYVLSKKYNVVIAHPERYTDIVGEEDYDRLFARGVIGQANAGSLILPGYKEFVFKMIESGKIKLLGTDAHNVVTRPPILRIGYDAVLNRLGEQYVDIIEDTARQLLNLS